MSYHHFEVAHIAAISRNHVIGKDNQLPWHISADLQHFKRLTQRGVVIMGRKTFESMGRPLPNRANIVITRDTDWAARMADADIIVCHNLDDALTQAAEHARAREAMTLWLIGGEHVFDKTMPITDRLEITEVDTDIPDGTAFYPAIPADFVAQTTSEWQHDDKSGLAFRFIHYQRQH
ncbi:dihydrofolate reductase [Moraxella atlantae]|uniref:dihydrofolate reductase n=1 Tax=Faucicola atlantae TaxID=34059 RepID=UPI00375126DB